MKLDAISIVTADMSAAVRFYSALGLDLVDGGPDAPHSEFSTGTIRLLLDTQEVMKGIDPEWVPPTGGHKMAIAFDCSTAEAVDETFAQLTRGGAGSEDGARVGAGDSGPIAGVSKEPWDAFWGQRYAVITDPDGNLVDLFAALN